MHVTIVNQWMGNFKEYEVVHKLTVMLFPEYTHHGLPRKVFFLSLQQTTNIFLTALVGRVLEPSISSTAGSH